MSSVRTFKQRMAHVMQLWEKNDFDSALAKVEELQQSWPGNAYLRILWASLVQLQERTEHSLDEAKQALQQAIDLDKSSPAGVIELGHFLDNVEDNPQGASKVYAEGVAGARQLLMEGLIGQAKALLQLDKKQEALRCLLEVLNLMQFQPASKREKSAETLSPILFGSLADMIVIGPLRGPFAVQVKELLNEVLPYHSA